MGSESRTNVLQGLRPRAGPSAHAGERRRGNRTPAEASGESGNDFKLLSAR